MSESDDFKSDTVMTQCYSSSRILAGPVVRGLHFRFVNAMNTLHHFGIIGIVSTSHGSDPEASDADSMGRPAASIFTQLRSQEHF